jgi:hypothetical protein
MEINMITARPGFSCLVETVGLGDIARFGGEYVKRVLMSGGVFVCHVQEGLAEGMSEDMKVKTKAYEMELIRMMEGTDMIQVLNEFQGRLSQQDMDALLLHEEGHVLLGHTQLAYQKHMEKIDGILIDIPTEIAADAYSASRIGKRNMAKALTHVIETMCYADATRLYTQPLNTERYQMYLTAMLTSEYFRKRFEALQ